MMDIKSAQIKISSIVVQSISEFCIGLGVSRTKQKKYLKKSYLDKVLRIREEFSLPVNLLNDLMINPLFAGSSPHIISENEYFIAIEKPANIHMHPLSYSEQNNLLCWLRSIGRYDLLSINQDSYDRSLLYRLDFHTSGLVLVCKNEDMFYILRKKFNSLVKTKTYHAIVKGRPGDGEFHDLLTSYGPKGSKMRVSEQGAVASIIFKELEYSHEKNLSLLEVNLNQGIRHQIRVQLSHHGFPILGDVLYGAEESDRLYLHAFKYEIIFKDEKFIFQSDQLITI